MRLGKQVSALAATTATVALAAPAHADADTDFASQLRSYGIYGPCDCNAWLAKITCERMGNGLDDTAGTSAQFLSHAFSAPHQHPADLEVPRRRNHHLLPGPDANAGIRRPATLITPSAAATRASRGVDIPGGHMHPSTRKYDLVVIGSGPGGQKAAIAAAKLGKSVAVIEHDGMLGGVCVHTGTIPSKTLREAVVFLTGITQREVYGGVTASRKTSPPPTCWPAPNR